MVLTNRFHSFVFENRHQKQGRPVFLLLFEIRYGILVNWVYDSLVNRLGLEPRDRWFESSHPDQLCGYSSGVERNVANVQVVGSIPITRSSYRDVR